MFLEDCMREFSEKLSCGYRKGIPKGSEKYCIVIFEEISRVIPEVYLEDSMKISFRNPCGNLLKKSLNT